MENVRDYAIQCIKDEANAIKEKLTAAGAEVEVK